LGLLIMVFASWGGERLRALSNRAGKVEKGQPVKTQQTGDRALQAQ
jgi:hypothetical protein